MWGYYGGQWWWILISVVPMILFWGTIILLVVWGVKQFSGDRRKDSVARETPLEIAQRRLARGEITTQEFEELKRALQ